MLSRQDNELITRVGPGTPMGEVFRRFWLPALLATELPEPDCAPIRLRLSAEVEDRPQPFQCLAVQNSQAALAVDQPSLLESCPPFLFIQRHAVAPDLRPDFEPVDPGPFPVATPHMNRTIPLRWLEELVSIQQFDSGGRELFQESR